MIDYVDKIAICIQRIQWIKANSRFHDDLVALMHVGYRERR